MTNRRIRAATWAVVVATMAAPGCGGDPNDIPPVAAEGTVMYDGKPLEVGTIQFVPEKGRTASGTIQNGKFVLTTVSPGDGAVPGKHQVAITANKEMPPQGKETDGKTVNLIPDKYSSYTGSGITVEIPSGGKKDITIDLKFVAKDPNQSNGSPTNSY